MLRRARGGKIIKLLLDGLSFSSLPGTQNGSGLISSHQLEQLLDLIPALHASEPVNRLLGQLQVVGTSRGLLKSSSLLLSSPPPRAHVFTHFLPCYGVVIVPRFWVFSLFSFFFSFMSSSSSRLSFFSSQLAGPDGVGRGSPRGPCPNMIGGRKHQVVGNVV